MIDYLSIELAGWPSPIIFCRDLNLHLEGDFDITSTCPYNGKKTKVFKATKGLIKEFGLKDVWYVQGKGAPGAAFYSAPHRKHVCLDYFFIPDEKILGSKIEIKSRIISDHNPVLLELDISLNPQPKAWTFERKLLLDPIYCEYMHKWIAEFFKNNRGSASGLIVWDTFKTGVQGKHLAIPSLSSVRTVQKLRRGWPS